MPRVSPTVVTASACDGSLCLVVTYHSNSTSPRAKKWYGLAYAVWFRGQLYPVVRTDPKILDAYRKTFGKAATKAEALAAARELARKEHLDHEAGIWKQATGALHLVKGD